MNVERNTQPQTEDAADEASPNARETVVEKYARLIAEIGHDARQAPLSYAEESRVPAGGE